MRGPNRFVSLRLFHDSTDFENVIEIARSDDAVFLRHSLQALSTPRRRPDCKKGRYQAWLANEQLINGDLSSSVGSTKRSQYAQRRIDTNWRSVIKSLWCDPSPLAKLCLPEHD